MDLWINFYINDFCFSVFTFTTTQTILFFSGSWWSTASVLVDCKQKWHKGEEIGLVFIIPPEFHVSCKDNAWVGWSDTKASMDGIESQISEKVPVIPVTSTQVNKPLKKGPKIVQAPMKKSSKRVKAKVDEEDTNGSVEVDEEK